MDKRLLYGTLAAACAATIPLQAWSEAHNWPLLTKLCDGDALVAVSVIYTLTALGVAVFGFLAANANAAHKGNNDKQ